MKVGARGSPLSRAQMAEICQLYPHLPIEPIWVDTTGDVDKKTSLRHLGKTDFFTRELDQMLFNGDIRAAVHSAKDLPEPIPSGLSLAVMTHGVDPRDVLVLRPNETLTAGAVIATSSARREESVRSLCRDLKFVDLRGTIGERLEKLQTGEVDGVVVAEAALIRLKLTPNRIFLPGVTAENQGRLAILVREGDEEMKRLFAPRTVLYLGLDPKNFPHAIHYPVIRTERVAGQVPREWPQFTHVIFTSRSAVRHWWEIQKSFDKMAIAIGEGTAGELRARGVHPLVAPEATQEGVIALLDRMDLANTYLFLPCSGKARSSLSRYLEEQCIRFFRLDLYDTLFQKPESVPRLGEVDEIVFTSPSTIEGFLRIFGELPAGKKLTAIGPITQKLIDNLLSRYTQPLR